MRSSIRWRIEKIMTALGVPGGVNPVIVERGDDGRIADISFRFAYRFNEAGAVVGIRVGGHVHARQHGEALGEFRDCVISSTRQARKVWQEFLRTIPPSRGLPNLDLGAIARWREENEAMRADVAADEVRRKGEGEWGERTISFTALTVTR